MLSTYFLKEGQKDRGRDRIEGWLDWRLDQYIGHALTEDLQVNMVLFI